ncbi:hypothetical protein TYRP_007759 [Tyrophagus putrescentiae]|nr:hypothetical protein TYRP_007759 [Tyrophagus putrescentiae]
MTATRRRDALSYELLRSGRGAPAKGGGELISSDSDSTGDSNRSKSKAVVLHFIYFIILED